MPEEKPTNASPLDNFIGGVNIDGTICQEPSTNAMIFEQVSGSIKVTLELLEQLDVKGIHEENRKQGCIWTLKGWYDNNLKHLQKELECKITQNAV